MEICGRKFSESILTRINAEVESSPELSRSELSRRVCQWLDWRDGRGRLKQMSARVALKRLEACGRIRLPPPRRRVPAAQPVTMPLEEIRPIETDLAGLGPVELVLIKEGDRKGNARFRGLLDRYHPLGSGPLCGAQLRYLVRCRQGYLGALAFSAPAWRVAARDRYIGWDEPTRAERLGQVVNNSRFLILPQVRAPNLASHVLGRAMRRLASDWEARYGIRPVLAETYVEADRRGSCYRAANWRMVGQTRGRGRQDHHRRRSSSPKGVYLYPLCRDWRDRLGGQAPGPKAMGQSQGAQEQDWTDEEFGAVELGDVRLNRRLRQLARDLYGSPQAQLPQACGSRAKTKAAYRFLDNKRVKLDTLLTAHHEATARRMSEASVVLAVQDSTSLNYSAHPLTEGLGPLNTRADQSIGLWMHDTLAFTPEGVPLGLIDVQVWARDPAQQGKRATRHQRPLEEKESLKWLKSYRAASALAQRLEQTRVVSVGDREADLYELFVEAAQTAGGADILVRANRTRRMTAEHGHLWDYMSQMPAAGELRLKIPRRGNQGAREAKMAVRHAPVTLKAPRRKSELPEVTLWAVWSKEVDAPEGVRPLEWMLLTTAPVETFEQACERIDWYTTRWQIEVYHRTLKSGCKIEERQLGSADRIEACLAIDLVVAWRIHHLSRLGRETPDVPCTAYFEEAQWQALMAFTDRTPTPPKAPPTLREAMRRVAGLGGFLGRKCDGEPGTKSLWLGLQRLDDITAAFVVFTGRSPPGVQRIYG